GLCRGPTQNGISILILPFIPLVTIRQLQTSRSSKGFLSQTERHDRPLRPSEDVSKHRQRDFSRFVQSQYFYFRSNPEPVTVLSFITVHNSVDNSIDDYFKS